MPKHLLPIAGIALALVASGCGKPRSDGKLDQLDAQLLANQSDPALTGKLADQIVVDPAKATKPGKPAGLAPPAPASKPKPAAAPVAKTAAAASPAAGPFAKVPPPIAPPPPGGTTLGALASAQASAPAKPSTAAHAPATAPANVGPVKGECYANLGYAASWANKLPPALPLYPGATLREAAGNAQAGCAVRIVSFTTRAAWRDVAGWYRAHAAKAGWSADETLRGGDHVVAGTAPDGGAFYLMLADQGAKGTAADLIVSLGH